MIESIQGRIPKTPRLSFDANEVSDEHVPAFLRRAKARIKDADYDSTNVVDIRNPRATTPISVPVEADAVEVTDEVVEAPITEDTTMDQMELVPEYLKPTDFDDLSVDQLREQEEVIQKAIQEKQKAQKQAVMEQVRDVLTQFQIPVEELVEFLGGIKTKRKGVPATVKFRDPVTGAEWSGRGKEPNWIKDQDREKFRIAD